MDTAEESVLTGNVAQAPQHFYQLVFCTVKSLALKLFYFNREHVTLFFFLWFQEPQIMSQIEVLRHFFEKRVDTQESLLGHQTI